MVLVRLFSFASLKHVKITAPINLICRETALSLNIVYQENADRKEETLNELVNLFPYCHECEIPAPLQRNAFSIMEDFS